MGGPTRGPSVFLAVKIGANHCYFVRAVKGRFGFRGKENFPAASLVCSDHRGIMFGPVMLGTSCAAQGEISLVSHLKGRRITTCRVLSTSQLIRTCKGNRLGNKLGRVTTNLSRRSGPILVLIGRGE